MKKIVITEWLKFISMKKPDTLKYENVYRLGYWNVLYHTDELETFLIENRIRYYVTEESLV